MPLKSELEAEVKAIFKDGWSTRDGNVVPDQDSIKLGNDGVNLNATVLYADLADSTVLVDSHDKRFAAEVYKAFLRCAARIIRTEGGNITAYDGDRVMAIFLGDTKNSTAARTALKINWAAKNIVQPALRAQYDTDYVVKHVVGIDTSNLLAARAGIRGSNDLVWIGRAANYAAKLAAMDDAYSTWITKAVYDQLTDASKLSAGTNMWDARSWTPMKGMSIYRSTYWWALT